MGRVARRTGRGGRGVTGVHWGGGAGGGGGGGGGGAAARAADRELHRDPDVHRSGVGVLQRAQDHRRGEVADVAVAAGEHGEGRVEERRGVGVVEADDRDVVGHGQAARPELAEAAEGEVGAGVDDRRRRRRLVQELGGLGPARRLGPVAGPDTVRVDREPVAAHRDAEPGEPLGARGLAHDPADVADPAVTVDVGEVTDEELHPRLVGERDPAGTGALDDVVEAHDREAEPPLDRADRRAVAARRAEDEAVDPAGGDSEEGRPLALRLLVGVHQGDLVAGRLEAVLGALQGVGVEAGADVGDDEPDHPGRPVAQRLARGRRMEVEAGGRPPDPLAGLVGDAAPAGQSPRRGGQRDPGGGGHVGQARRVVHHRAAPRTARPAVT